MTLQNIRSFIYCSSVLFLGGLFISEISACDQKEHDPVPAIARTDSPDHSHPVMIDTLNHDSLKLSSSIDDDTFRFRHHDGKFYYVMPCARRKWDDFWQYSILRVDIFSRTDSSLVQRITIKEPFEFTKYSVDYQFIMDDFNFDGYGDFSVRSWEMINFNSLSLYWLYDPKSGKFVENEELNGLWDASFDHQSHEVHSWENMTDSPIAEVNECYTWKNGKLYLQHSEECQDILMMDSPTIIMKKRIDGKLVTRSKKMESGYMDRSGHMIYDWDALK